MNDLGRAVHMNMENNAWWNTTLIGFNVFKWKSIHKFHLPRKMLYHMCWISATIVLAVSYYLWCYDMYVAMVSFDKIST